MGRRKLVVGNWKMNGMQAALDEVAAIGARAAQPAVVRELLEAGDRDLRAGVPVRVDGHCAARRRA